jgi:hypothetical protein
MIFEVSPSQIENLDSKQLVEIFRSVPLSALHCSTVSALMVTIASRSTSLLNA